MMEKLKLISLFGLIAQRRFMPYYNEFMKAETRSKEEREAIQLGKLKDLVTHAYRTVPYYKKCFDQAAFRVEMLQTLDDIKRIPFLEKSDLTSKFDDLTSSKWRIADLIEYSTGGSTGVPAKFLLTKNQYDSRAAVSFKSYQMTGWDFFMPTVFLSGAPIDRTRRDDIKQYVKDRLLKQLHVSAFALTDSKWADLCSYIHRHKVEAIFGYVSTLMAFARFLERSGTPLRIPIIVQMAELVLPEEKVYIEQHLRGRFFEHYGARDAIAIGIECNQRRGLHVNMDTLVVEILKNNREAIDADGEVVITDLYSFGMPLIRYKIGDVGRWETEFCSCGRKTRLFKITQGRKTNMIVTPEGIQVSGIYIAHLLKERAACINRYQFVQESVESVLVRLVVNEAYSHADQDYIERKLRVRLGTKIAISFEYPTDIDAEVSGKYLSIKSLVPASFGNGR
jgi:phenylacetate-CoA ligase